jgi:hypothetical protein
MAQATATVLPQRGVLAGRPLYLAATTPDTRTTGSSNVASNLFQRGAGRSAGGDPSSLVSRVNVPNIAARPGSCRVRA